MGSGGTPALSATRSINYPRLHPTSSATWWGSRPPRHGRGEERAPWRGAGGAGVRQVSGMGPRQVGSTLGAGLRLSLPAGEVGRAIRTGQLHASPRVHTRPIDVVVCHGSVGETWSCGGFPA